MTRLPDLEGWAVFARVAELGSFAAAAAELGLSTATVSKAVARLERRVGAALLSRTSRRVALTALGRTVAADAGRLLAESEALEAAAASQVTRPHGVVRIAAPMSFGVGHVAPLLPEFLAAHPAVSVELSLSDEVVDLVGGGFDLALRLSSLPDSSLRARLVCGMRRLTVASPAWLARCGAPARPDDVPEGEMFGYAYARPASRVLFRHAGSGAEVTVETNGRVRANNGEAMVPMLLAGLGIASLPEFMVWEALQSGALVSVLEEWRAPAIGLSVVTSPGRARPLRVTLAIEFLVERLGAAPWAA